jgi:hypothetical protein
MAPVAPQVSYKDGQLTIVAPNSTLGDILRGVRKHTSADIEIPPTASERVVTRLGPGPAPEVMAELLNGSHFNYILLGSPDNANQLVRVVLVAKVSDTPAPKAPGETKVASADSPDAPDPDPAEDAAEDNPDQATPAEVEQPIPAPVPADQQAVKTPQQMLQEMQQRQLQMQQQPGQPGIYPPGRPGTTVPEQPAPPQPEQQQ